jgi:hypothetical protein
MTTTTTYDPRGAALAARTVAEMRLGEVHEILAAEFDEACTLATEYAEHLAADGDPIEYPTSSRDNYVSHGLLRRALDAVFDAWNESRERQSITRPWQQRVGGAYTNVTSWLVQEALLNSLGTPVAYADLRNLRGRPSPQDVAAAAWLLQVVTKGELRVRKTKAAGKVAWLVREYRPGDDEADLHCREGYYPRADAGDTAVARREALEQPFRTRVFDYPEEA